MAKETPLKGVGAFKQLRMDLQLAFNAGSSWEKIEILYYRPYPTNNPWNKWHEKSFLQPNFRGDWQELLVCQKCFLVVDANDDAVNEHIRKGIDGTSPCERRQESRKAQPSPSNSAKQQPDPKPKPQPSPKSRKSKKKSKKKKCEKFIKDIDGECGSDLEISDTPDSGKEEEEEATCYDPESDAEYKPQEESPSGSRSGDTPDSGKEEEEEATCYDPESDAEYKPQEESPSGSRSGDTPDSGKEEEEEATCYDPESDAEYKPQEESPSGSRSGDTPDSGKEEEEEATYYDPESDAEYKPQEESPSGSRSGDTPDSGKEEEEEATYYDPESDAEYKPQEESPSGSRSGDTPDSGKEEEEEATYYDPESDAEYKPQEESPSGSRSGDSGPEESLDDTAAEGASVQPIKVDYTEFYRCGSTERFGRKQIQCEECFLYFEEKYYFRMHYPQRTRDGFDAEKGKGKTPEEHPQDLFLPDVLPTTKDDRVMCPWKNCFKTFSTESKLKKHWRSHTSEKPHACWKCGQTFGKSSGAKWCEQMHSFKYTKEQVQQMVNEVDNAQLTYYNGSEQASTKLNINYCEILVDGKLAPYVVCTECFEVVARIDATGSGHDCKAAANDGKGTPASTTVGVIGRIDIPPPDLLSSCLKYEMSDVSTRELAQADPLRKRFLYVLYKDNETGCIKCRGCSAVFPKDTAEMSNINAHVCPAAKKRKVAS